jgi:hypothetical protein
MEFLVAARAAMLDRRPTARWNQRPKQVTVFEAALPKAAGHAIFVIWVMRSIRPYREAVSQRSPGSRACERTLGNNFEFILRTPPGFHKSFVKPQSSGLGHTIST